MAKITFYFDCVSPYSWFAFECLMKYSKIWPATIDLKPMFLGAVMKSSENAPPGFNIHKQKYMQKYDIPRCLEMFGVERFRFPNDFPASSLLALRALTVIKEKYPEKLEDASRSLWKCYFEANKGFLAKSIEESFLPYFSSSQIKEILENANQEEFKSKLNNSTQEALNEGAFGAPWIVCERDDGMKSVFFGSDRFEAIAYFFRYPYMGYSPKGKL